MGGPTTKQDTPCLFVPKERNRHVAHADLLGNHFFMAWVPGPTRPGALLLSYCSVPLKGPDSPHTGKLPYLGPPVERLNFSRGTLPTKKGERRALGDPAQTKHSSHFSCRSIPGSPAHPLDRKGVFGEKEESRASHPKNPAAGWVTTFLKTTFSWRGTVGPGQGQPCSCHIPLKWPDSPHPDQKPKIPKNMSHFRVHSFGVDKKNQKRPNSPGASRLPKNQAPLLGPPVERLE